VSTAVSTPVTAAAIREVIVELERMRQDCRAQTRSRSTLRTWTASSIRFETTEAIAGALASLRTLQLPNDFTTRIATGSVR
jgi:hypothetical protein